MNNANVMPVGVYSVHGNAQRLKRDRSTINRIIVEKSLVPYAEKGRSKYFHISEIVSAMSDSEELDLQQERAKLTKKQTEKTEIQIEELKSVVVDADDVKEEWSKHIMSCRAKLLALPTKMASEVLTIDSLQEAQDVIKRHVTEALEELAAD